MNASGCVWRPSDKKYSGRGTGVVVDDLKYVFVYTRFGDMLFAVLYHSAHSVLSTNPKSSRAVCLQFPSYHSDTASQGHEVPLLAILVAILQVRSLFLRSCLRECSRKDCNLAEIKHSTNHNWLKTIFCCLWKQLFVVCALPTRPTVAIVGLFAFGLQPTRARPWKVFPCRSVLGYIEMLFNNRSLSSLSLTFSRLGVVKSKLLRSYE